VKSAWFDLAIIVLSPPFIDWEALQGTRSLRVLRVLRLFRAGAVLAIGLRSGRRALGRRQFHYVALLGLAVVALGAIAVYAVESGQNRAIGSVGDAIWWAIVTATTVGYGDVSPVTPEGRVIAVVLMLVGIGIIGVFTATIASFFVGQDQTSDQQGIEARLASIEKRLDEIAAELRQRHSSDR
jgi:voltage-gated potassium channel